MKLCIKMKGGKAVKLLSYDNLAHATSGSVGSMTAMAIAFPLDTVRFRLQMDDGREAKTAVKVLVELVREEGFFTLYRGMGPFLKSLCVSNFVYFYAFHGLKQLQGAQQQSALRDLGLGLIAGAINVLSTTPLWVVNSRIRGQGLNLKSKENRAVAQKYNYTGMIDGLMKIYESEGIAGLWRGVNASLILIVNPAAQFTVYEMVKRRLKGPDDKELSAFTYFSVGALAKLIAVFLTYPIQIVQQKFRFGHKMEGLRKNSSVLEMIVCILQKQGVRGMYKGLEAKMLQTVLTAALMFLFYEKIRSFVMLILKGQAKVKV